GLISGYILFSFFEGSQVVPVGGPNKAQLCNFLAMRVVVNLASIDWSSRAICFEEKASLPNSTPILPLCFWYSCCHLMSLPSGRKTTLAGFPLALGIVSRRTSMSLTLLQPQ